MYLDVFQLYHHTRQQKNWHRNYQCMCRETVLHLHLTHHKLFNISLQANVWKIRHHVSNDLEPCIFGHLKRFAHCSNSVASVCITSHILVYTLYSNLQPCAAILQHVTVGMKKKSINYKNTWGSLERLQPLFPDNRVQLTYRETYATKN